MREVRRRRGLRTPAVHVRAEAEATLQESPQWRLSRSSQRTVHDPELRTQVLRQSVFRGSAARLETNLQKSAREFQAVQQLLHRGEVRPVEGKKSCSYHRRVSAANPRSLPGAKLLRER